MASPMPVFGEEVYPDLHVKGAVLLAALNRNHALSDGNTRLSWVTAVAFFEINGVDIVVDNQADIDEFVRRVAAGGMPLDDIAAWLRAHAHPLGEPDAAES
jgi:death-on-curing protein